VVGPTEGVVELGFQPVPPAARPADLWTRPSLGLGVGWAIRIIG